MPIPEGWKRIRRAPDVCVCGCSYAEFRTGLSFREVRRLMWVPGEHTPSNPWRRRSRGNVLGMWHELKLMQWWAVHSACPEVIACEG